MTFFKRRPRIIVFLLGIIALVTAVIFVFPLTQHTAHAQTLTGVYNVSTHFLTGPQAGQTDTGTLTFNQDGSVQSNYPQLGLTGKGYWWVVNGQLQYSFREVFPNNGGDVQVVHLVTDPGENRPAVTSQGRGLLYTPDGKVQAVSTVNTLTPA